MISRALLLVVLGLTFGPGYFAFCEYLSGRPGPNFSLTDRDSRWSMPDGSILRLRGGMAYRPVPLDLTPENNGYRLRFTFNVTQADASDAANEYQMSLMQADTTIAERSIRVKGRGKVDVALDPLQVFYPGGYTLILEEVGTPRLAVGGVGLQIDTNVEKPRMWIAWSGLALLAVGVGFLLRAAFLQARRKR
jgi:hypothetical protein